MNMESIFVLLCIIVIFGIGYLMVSYFSRDKDVINQMSFREAMDLCELPVVTFYNGSNKLNFLLDTGSNISQINASALPLLNYERMKDSTMDITGIEGNKVNTEFCKMSIVYKNQEFIGEFCIHDLDDAFAIVKEESGVQIHGILGSLFFQKYKYIFDFESLVAYSKK